MNLKRTLATLAALAAFLGGASIEAQDVEVRAELVFNFSDPLDTQPIEAVAPPGDTGRLFVGLQRGRIRILDLADDSLKTGVFLDIRSRIAFGGERGFLGLAFHPDYGTNRFFFVYYTRLDGDIVISRFERSAADADLADAGSEKVLLTIEHSSQGNHNGGKIAFGPNDGYLYAGTGDGGSGCDPPSNSQNTQSLLGKLLRLDVDSGETYGIPATNPFASTSDGIRDEIWALGLRNPWRWSFDRETGDLYIADVGQGTWEEIDIQPASSAGGENYQWKIREGNHGSGCSGIPPFGPGTSTNAVFDYNHNGGRASVTGGYVYKGSRMPALRGTYFFAEYELNWVKSFRFVGEAVTDQKDRTAELNMGIAPDLLDQIASFGEDGNGELYILDHPTKLFRIVPAGPGPIGQDFIRANSNADDTVDISDAVFTLIHLFLGGGQPLCEDAVDANDDGILNLTDAIFTLDGLFAGGPQPPEPSPACGSDPTSDALGCETTTCE